jgi:type I restriction enzyme S subunit
VIPETAIGDVALVFNGKTPSKAEQRLVGHPVLKIKDVDEQENFIGVFDSYVDHEFSNRFKEKALKQGDFLILNAAHNADYVGSKRYCTTGEVVGAIPTGEWTVIRASKSRIVQGYLNHWLRLPTTAFKFRRLVKGIHLYPRDIASLRLPLPDLDEQRRVVAILDKVDDIRRKRSRALAETDTLLRAVFLDRFGDPATDPKRIGKAPLSEFGRIVTGNTPPRAEPAYFGEGIEWIKSDNINTPSHFLTPAHEQLSPAGEQVARVVPAGSILVTCIAGSPDSIGKAALADRRVAFNQQINAIIPNVETDPYFLYAQMLVGKRLIQRASTNSMKGMVSKSNFEIVDFIKPKKMYQDKFGLWCKKYFRVHQNLQTAFVASQDLFDSLSQRAFGGGL